ncbi:MAG: efflux RND transporter periplasmic adaptor subunit [Verrucomicrobia bacterium]|nr:efflux RND transporter periplasmic adaptor subunit [Verrucomicrobiota bacterium]
MSLQKATLDDLRIERGPAEREGSRAWVLGVVIGTLAVVAAGGWWFTRSRAAAEVRTLTVRESGVGGQRILLNASGYVTARREATVSSKVTGKVVEVLIEEGMRVKDGQVLARLDSSNVETNLRLAQAQLASARSALEETKSLLRQADLEYRRIRSLATSQIASASDLDKAEADFKSLAARLERQQADVAVAERQVGVYQQDLDDTVIRAPFTGVVVSKNAQPGEMISPISAGGGFTRTGICTVVDMDSLEIEIDVNESYINRVQVGQPVEATLDAYPDWKIPAKVIAIIPTADRQKATVKVRVGFERLDPRLLPDMSVKVAFETAAGATGGRRGLMIPRGAVHRQDGRDVVFVVNDGRVERRAVTLGASTQDETSVVAGLSAGERIVVDGPENLADGERVKESKS